MPLTQEYHLLSRTVILVIALSILIITIAGAFLFNFMKQLSSPSPGTEDISQPIDWSIAQEYENYELNYEGMILERGVGVGNITKFLEKPVEIVYCKGCSSCTGINLRTNTIPGTDIYNCSSCNTCNEVVQPNRFKNCWGCTNTTGLLNENCTLCDDTGEELQICKKLKACIYEHYADKSYKELHGCLIEQTPFNESTSFDVVAFKNILKTCRSESIKINIGNNFSKELCYFNNTSISYYDFERPSDFYIKYTLHSEGSDTAQEDSLSLMPFYKKNKDAFPHYRIYVAINGTPNKEYSVGIGKYPDVLRYDEYIRGFTGYSASLGKIKTDSTGFGYEEFVDIPDKATETVLSLIPGVYEYHDFDWKNEPEKYPIKGVKVSGPSGVSPQFIYATFYANDIGSNLEWTNELRYSNCNFNTNIESYLEDRPWWAYNSDNLNSSWNLWDGNSNSSIKVFCDPSMPAGGNSAQRSNLKIQLGRLDTDFLRECKFDLYVCSQDAFAESEDDGILALSDFFTNFNPSNVYTTINDGNKEIILYNYFEFNLNKPYDIEEINSAIKTGFRLWETNKFLYDSSSTGLKWLRNNNGIYGASWTEISGGPGFNEDCWNSDVTNSVKSGNARVLIGNCPNNNCTEKLKIRVAFKYIKPSSTSPLIISLYPTITFCSAGSGRTGLPAFCGDGNCDVGEDYVNCPSDCPPPCSTYNQATCPSSRCVWCTECSGQEWSGGPDRCIGTGTCHYWCEYDSNTHTGECGATCANDFDCGGNRGCDLPCKCVINR